MEPLNTPISQKEFWNLRAKTFPRYSPETDNYETGMLKLAQAIGADFKDKTILDVGCGTGMYTLRLALMGKFVTALDISEEMLAINREDAQNNGLTNIEHINMDFLNFTPQRKYDLIFCSMTPALQTEEGNLKLLSFPKAQVVFFGFSAPMKNQVINELFNLYDLEPIGFKSSPEQKAFLDANGIKYQITKTSGRWVKTLSREDMLLNITSTLSFHGRADNGRADQKIDLESFIDRFSDGQGGFTEITDYQVEVIVWTNN
jgi:SAM-dependent methyltransferase